MKNLKKTRATLSESESRFRYIFDAVPECVKLLGPDGSLLEMNRSGLRMIEADSFQQVANRSLYPFIVEEYRNAFEELNRKVFAGESGVLEYEIVGLKGGRRWMETHASPLRDTSGAITALLSITRDITEIKLADESLRRSKEQVAGVINSAMDAIITIDEEKRVILFNKAAEKMFLVSSDEAIGQPHDRFIPERFRSDHRLHIRNFSESNVASRRMGHGMLQLLGIRSNGEEFPIETTISKFESDGKKFYTVILRDLTERQQAVAERTRLLSVLERTLNEIYIFDVSTLHFDYVNECARSNLGYSMDAMLKLTPVDLAPEFTEATFDKFIGPLRRREIPKIVVETVNRRADGSIYPVEVHLQLVDTGEKEVFLAVINDITDRRVAESALRESNEKFHQLADNITDVFWIRSPDLREVYYISPAYERIWGRSVESLYANPQKWADFIHPEDRKRVIDSFTSLVVAESDLNSEYRIVRPDGEIRWVCARGFPVKDATEKLIRYAGIITDITERKQLEDQFRQAQKMEGIGQLAGGVAHDFNNLLTAITGYSQITLRRLKPEDPLRQNIEEINNACNRATELTGQLLAFSRKQVLKPRVHSINSVISNIEKMLRRIIKESIELRIVLDPELGNVKADPSQIEQVIMNLAVNARDAMPNGGTLTIETQNIYLDKDYTNQHAAFTPGPFVRMSVTDTGEGIDARTQRRIFEPFFTTKEVGQGTGLGLSTVHGIIKQSGGEIMVYSEIGHGTTFKVYLPRVDEAVQIPKWREDSREDYSGTETILLVEDDEIVRKLVLEILTSSGYHVLEANSGQAALSICDTYSEPIQMLLTDMIMPGMSGKELKDLVVKLRPGIKPLLMSGYTSDPLTTSMVLDSDTAFIEKPFTPDGLVRKIREVLESQ